MGQPEQGEREGGLVAFEPRPADRDAGGPLIQPGQEPDGSERRVHQVGGQRAEALGVPGEPVRLGRTRRCQPGQLGERSQRRRAHRRRDRGRVSDGSEQLAHEACLVTVENLRRGGGQAEDERLGQVVEHFGQEPPPHLEEVMALVQDDRDRAEFA